MPVAWLHFEYTVTDLRREGLAQAVVAGPDPTDSEVVRFAAPSTKRIIRWVVASMNDWPEAPAFTSLNPNLAREESEITAHSPIPTGSASEFLYVVWGVYRYFLKLARPADAGFSVGDMPKTVALLGGAQKVFPSVKFARFLDTGLMY